jgi:AcrR family transcriptional regulator
VSTLPVTDRRRRRHQATAEEVVGHALEVMAESGAAGLSLGEVARRMGMRTPSLYVYFPSKAAVYDEVFARGWRAFVDTMQEYDVPLHPSETVHDRLTAAMSRCLEWAAAHPAYAQLMFWRPVPAWEPSPAAYAAAVEAVDLTHRVIAGLRDAGHLATATDPGQASEVWTLLVSGLISQRLSNEPAVPLAGARTTALVEPLVTSFLLLYGR